MSAMVFLEVDDIHEIHRAPMERFGGAKGILSQEAVESAVPAPRNVLFHEEGDLVDCAAALMWHLCSAHACTDGNKRVGTVAGIVMLSANGVVLPNDPAAQDALTDLMFAVADHRASRQDVAGFLRSIIR
jgi:death-on-curing protein